MNKADLKKREDKLKRVKQIKTARHENVNNIAAFDQANLCGVVYQLGNEKYKCELWDLTLKPRESQGMKWIRFESRVSNFLKENKIKILAYELPAGRNIKPIIHSSKLIGIIETVCMKNNIDYIEFSASEVKKFATGKGNANKKIMIEYAKKLWKYEGDNDNEADAVHILHLLKSKIN